MGGSSRVERLKAVILLASKGRKGSSGQRAEAHTLSRHPQCICWNDLPVAVLAQALGCLEFQERCQAALVCTSWCAIVCSAAGHARDQSDIPLPDTRTLPCDVTATEEQLQLKLQQCRAIRYAPSATLTLNDYAPATMQQLNNLTRLVLLDPVVLRQQLDGEAWAHTPPKPAVPVPLHQLHKLQVLSVAMASPLLDVPGLPGSLRALHLDLSSGYSVKQLSELCEALSDAADCLPQLRHLSIGMELDALLSSGQGAGLTPLAGCTQLTSISLVEYQYMHPDSPAHEGYALVPPVLQELPNLKRLSMQVNSGQSVDLTPASGIPDVNLALTLAHYEQTPFNRLPSSLGCLTGLTSLSVLMAEYAYDEDRDLYIFDARPLASCPKLRRLLLELHGVKSSLHDLQGLADLTGLTELVVLLKCPDVHEARPDAAPSSVAGSSSSSGGGGGGGSLGLPGVVAAGGGSVDWEQAGSLLASVPGRLMSLFGKHGEHQRQRRTGGGGNSSSGPGGSSSSMTARALAAHVAETRSAPAALVSEEWVLALVDHALDQLRPEFALSVPVVSGKLLIATTSRLHLRQPENFTKAAQPMLLASQLQPDLSNCGDCWGGESFLHPMNVTSLRSWVSRCWAPGGVELLPAARHPVLGTYPGCRKRIDDKLRVAARRGVSGAAVVEAIMAVAEAQCMSHFI